MGLGLHLFVALALLGGCRAEKKSASGSPYPDIDYRPRYHITCERGQVDYPSIAYTHEISGKLVYHIFYHCSALPTNGGDVEAADTWYHTTSTDLMRWQTSELRGIPAGTTSVSITQPAPNATKAVVVFSKSDGIYLAHSEDTTLILWYGVSTKPIITPPVGAGAFSDAHLWSNGTSQYFILVGSTLNGTERKGIHDGSSVPVMYLYESKDLKNWTTHGIFWQGDSQFGPTAKSVDFFEVYNAQLRFKQQVLSLTFQQEARSFCISGLFNFTTFHPFQQYTLRHEDYGRLKHTSSILDSLGRRLMIGTVDDMRSVGWQAFDKYAGVVSLPRTVLSLPADDIGFQAPEDVSSLYGKSLGRLDGIRLQANETETYPLFRGNQMTIKATLAVTVPSNTNFSAGFHILMADDMSEYTTVSVKNDPGSQPQQCMDIPVSHGMDRIGGDYRIFEVSELAQCKAACCSDPVCRSFVYDFKMIVNIGFNCTVGSTCCFLKTTTPPLSPSLLNLTSGMPSTLGGVVSVSTKHSSLSPEVYTEEVTVPFQHPPPSLIPDHYTRGQQRGQHERNSKVDKSLVKDAHISGSLTEAVTIQLFIDHSLLEVFIDSALVITERVYPTRQDSLNVQLFSINADVTFTTIEAYQMESAFDN